MVFFGMILEFNVSKEGKLLDPKQIHAIMKTSGNPCLQGTNGFQVWHISSGRKVISNLEHPLSHS
jgi:hypothetical protein